MMKQVDEIIEYFEKKCPLWLLIFLISMLNFVSFDTWPNEENNFTMARHFLDPDWMPTSFSLQQWPGANFIYWTIAGFGLKFLSFGQLAFWARTINYLLYAFPLAGIFKSLRIRTLLALLILQIFFFKQTYLTGEWIWSGFEGKTLAYLFIFWSLHYLLKRDYNKMSLFASLATYCHVLVGGWFFAGIGIHLLLSKTKFKLIFKSSLIYLVMTLPFIGYLAAYLLAGEKSATEPSPDYIYVFYRNAHHLVPTLKTHFWHNEWPFVLLMVLSLILVVNRWFDNERHQIIAMLVVAFNLMLLAGLILTYVDHQGTFLKFYVLRMSSLALLLELILASIILRSISLNQTIHYLLRLCQILILGALIVSGILRNRKNWQVTPKEKNYELFVDFVSNNTSKNARFCFIHFNDKTENVSFINDAERDRLVSFKMVPEGDLAIIQWYERLKKRESVEKEPSTFIQLAEEYELTHLVSAVPLREAIDLELLYHNEHYYLYQVN